MCRPPAGIRKSSGRMMSTRSGSTEMLADDSTISWIVFMLDQTPAKRLIANACRPMSRMSCTLDGKNTGSPQALKMWSLWCAAVDPGSLAVPDAEHAVEFLRLRVQVEHLRAPHRGRRELLVDAGLEHDVLRGEMGLRLPQRLVVAAERRAAVAADETGGVEAVHRVALLLQHRQADQRLHAAHEGAARFERVLVVERDGLESPADRLGKRRVHGFVSCCLSLRRTARRGSARAAAQAPV